MVNIAKDFQRKITDVTLAHVVNLGKIADSLRVPLLIVWIPAPEELYLIDSEDNKQGISYTLFKSELDSLISQLTSDITFFDPVRNMNKQLVNGKTESSFMYLHDGHFNETGNKIFATACLAEVCSFVNGR